jgi:hypothetical protein
MNDIDEIEKRYGHLFVVAFCLSLLLAVVGFAVFDHWFWLRLQSDFWPVDKATVAPNIVASIIIFDVVTLTAALFYPPFKKALDKGLSRHTKAITSHVSAENADLHAKLDHIIKHHPDIPEMAAKRSANGRFAKKTT